VPRAANFILLARKIAFRVCLLAKSLVEVEGEQTEKNVQLLLVRGRFRASLQMQANLNFRQVFQIRTCVLYFYTGFLFPVKNV